MTYEEQLNWFWQLDEVHSFTGNETKLYLYLLRIAMNSLGACESFQQSNERVAGNTGLTVNELRTARNRLMQIGMIVFTTGGKGRNDVSRWSLVTPKGLKKGGSKVDPKVYPKVNPKVYPKIDPLIPFPSDSPILEIQIPPDIPEGISAPTGAKTAKSTGKPDDLDAVIRYGEEIGLPLTECQKFFDHFTS
ncbi:MAG: hypothetical protein HUU10_15775, partial [Bacteroidetes bacterium]|nr:hypothetical protein [Bacteroidota bacterium]